MTDEPRALPDMRVEVAWTTDPMTRPAPEDWTRIDGPADHATLSGLRRVSTSRGARVKTGEIEAGVATLTLDNRNRSLDPTYTGSPYWPNVTLRKRVRVIAEPVGDDWLLTEAGDNIVTEAGDQIILDTSFVLFTGFVDDISPRWEIGDAVVDIVLTDLFGIVADLDLPPSVIYATTVAAQPEIYWPMTETQGSVADDVMGDVDGAYTRPVADNEQLVPYDSERCQRLRKPNDVGDTAGFSMAAPFVEPDEFTIRGWIRLLQRTDDSVPMYLFMWVSQIPVAAIIGGASPVTSAGSGFLFGGDGSTTATGYTDGNLLFDGRAHHVVFLVYRDPDPYQAGAGCWIDGVFQEFTGAVGGIDWDIPFANCNTMRIGMNEVGLTDQIDYAVGHVAIWRRLLTDAEILADYDATSNAWDGDNTVQRLTRILDFANIDDADRELTAGGRVCSGTELGGTVGSYFRKIAATEEGAIYVDTRGRVKFVPAPTGDPVVTFAGNPTDGVPYADLAVSFGIDRVVNIANVSREGGPPIEIRDTSSVDAHGPKDQKIDTLLESSATARDLAARVVDAGKDPRQTIEGVTLRTRRADVQLTALGVEVAQLVSVASDPTGPGTGTTVVARVERVEHDIDFQAKDWTTRIGLDQIT